jgi:multidrug efflux pump subunit AcrA (membrane-fusion protein)
MKASNPEHPFDLMADAAAAPARRVPSVLMDRRKLLALTVGIVVLSAVAGWIAGSRIRSPGEAAARTAPPQASPILVPAEQRVLSTDVVTRGTSRFGSPQQLALAPSALKTAPGIPGRLPAPGSELGEGGVIFTTSGRPVFLLQGSQPAYRDIGPGAEGDDVRQLEEALARLGFAPGDVDGVFDASTAAAVSAWYRDAGFAPYTASAEQLAAISALETDRNAAQLEVITAEEAVAAAEAALVVAQGALTRATDAAGLSAPSVEKAIARANTMNGLAAKEVAAKQSLLKALEADPDSIPSSPAEIAAAEAALSLAISDQEATRQAGIQMVNEIIEFGGLPSEVAAARAQADLANQAAAAEVAAARAALDQVRAGTPGTGATAAEIAAARAELAAAQTNAEATRLAGEQEIADAQATGGSADADVAAAQADVAAAEKSLSIAQAALDARKRLAGLASLGLGRAQVQAGVQVPADEIVFVASAPVRIAEVTVTDLGPSIALTDATVAVDGALRLEEAPLVKTGMRVEIDEPDLGITATGVVRRVAESPGTNGVDGFHVYFEVLVDNAPRSLVGASVRMTVPIESTGGSVLAVPVSAVTLSADGSSRVQRQRDGKLEFVTVEPGLSANGFVSVRPVEGELAAGDLVVVGFDQGE